MNKEDPAIDIARLDSESKRPLPAEIFLRHPLHFMAFGAGSGLFPFGPGTAGTLWAWLSFVLLEFMFGWTSMVVLTILAFGLGVWACEKTGRVLGQPDHSSVVIDEIASFWLILLLLPRATLGDQVFGPHGLGAPSSFFWLSFWAFVLFRFFDIVKPPPIRQVDRLFKSGWGVMFDDLLAAGYTLLLIAILLRLGLL